MVGLTSASEASVAHCALTSAAMPAAGQTGLVRDQPHAQNLARDFGGLRRVLRDFNAAALTAPAGVNLRLHHYAAADVFRRGLRFFRGERHFPARHRDAVLAKDGLCLILV